MEKSTTSGVVTNFTSTSIDGPDGIDSGTRRCDVVYQSVQRFHRTDYGIWINLHLHSQEDLDIQEMTAGPDGAMWFRATEPTRPPAQLVVLRHRERPPFTLRPLLPREESRLARTEPYGSAAEYQRIDRQNLAVEHLVPRLPEECHGNGCS